MLTAAAVWTTDASLSTPGKVLADAGAMMLIARMTSDGNVSIAQILSWRPVVYLGKISYEIYLWHYPLLVVVSLALGGDFVTVAWFVVPSSIIAAALAERLTRPQIARLRNRFC